MTVAEVLAALGLLLAASVTSAQLFGVVAQKQRTADRQQEAALVLANWMEVAASIPSDELTEEKLLAALAASKAVPDETAGLFEPEAKVVEQSEPPAGKRVMLRLSWAHPSGAHRDSLELFAWRFASRGEETER